MPAPLEFDYNPPAKSGTTTTGAYDLLVTVTPSRSAIKAAVHGLSSARATTPNAPLRRCGVRRMSKWVRAWDQRQRAAARPRCGGGGWWRRHLVLSEINVDPRRQPTAEDRRHAKKKMKVLARVRRRSQTFDHGGMWVGGDGHVTFVEKQVVNEAAGGGDGNQLAAVAFVP